MNVKLRNRGAKTTYEHSSEYSEACKMAFNCPTCGTRKLKGDTIFVGTFLHTGNNFHIRSKRFCSFDCIPESIQSNNGK